MQSSAASAEKHRNESVRVRTGVKAGGGNLNHNLAVKVSAGN